MTAGRVRVVVATTEGPSTVLRVTAEDASLRSVVCLGRTTATLPISGAYDAFVRAPTGVVERAVGHPAFRVDVSARIDDGDSWQLGFYLAHRLKAVGRLAEDGAPADLVVWATGAVDGDLTVRPVEQVAEKRRRSDALLADIGAPVLAVVPAGEGEALAGLPAGVEALHTGTVQAVLERLGIQASPPAGSARRRRAALAVAGAAAALAAGWFALPARDAPPAPTVAAEASAPAIPAFESSTVRLAVLEHRPVDGAACGSDERAEPVEPGRETPPGVCGITARATNDGSVTGNLWLVAVVEGTFREYAGSTRSVEVAAGPIAPGETAEVRVSAPAWVRRPVVFRVLLVLAGRDRIDVSNALAGVDAMSTEDIDRLTGHLLDLGLDVRTVRHRVVPRGR